MTDLAEPQKNGQVRSRPARHVGFVLFETLVFTGYFGVYLFNRARSPSSSCTPRRTSTCVRGFQHAASCCSAPVHGACALCGLRRRAPVRNDRALLTADFGRGVPRLQGAEWVRLIHAGHGFPAASSNYYFFLTGIHFCTC